MIQGSIAIEFKLPFVYKSYFLSKAWEIPLFSFQVFKFFQQEERLEVPQLQYTCHKLNSSTMWTEKAPYVPGFGETNHGLRLADVFTVPSTRHRLDGAHTGPGDSYGQGHEGVAISRTTSSIESFFSRATPFSWRPHSRV